MMGVWRFFYPFFLAGIFRLTTSSLQQQKPCLPSDTVMVPLLVVAGNGAQLPSIHFHQLTRSPARLCVCSPACDCCSVGCTLQCKKRTLWHRIHFMILKWGTMVSYKINPLSVFVLCALFYFFFSSRSYSWIFFSSFFQPFFPQFLLFFCHCCCCCCHFVELLYTFAKLQCLHSLNTVKAEAAWWLRRSFGWPFCFIFRWPLEPIFGVKVGLGAKVKTHQHQSVGKHIFVSSLEIISFTHEIFRSLLL